MINWLKTHWRISIIKRKQKELESRTRLRLRTLQRLQTQLAEEGESLEALVKEVRRQNQELKSQLEIAEDKVTVLENTNAVMASQVSAMQARWDADQHSNIQKRLMNQVGTE